MTYGHATNPEPENSSPGLEDPEHENSSPQLEDPEHENSSPGLEDPEPENSSPPLEDPDFAPTAAASGLGGGPGRRQPRRPFESGREPGRRRYSGDVIVRMSPLLARSNASNLVELAEVLDLTGLANLLERFKSPASAPGITTPHAKEVVAKTRRPRAIDPPMVPSLEALEWHATTGRDLPPRHSLSTYWRVDARSLVGRTDKDEEVLRWEAGFPLSITQLTREFVRQLNSLSEVDLAYRELMALDPESVPPADDELSDFQFYLDEQPVGLNVRWLQSLQQGQLSPITVADLEQGWLADHEDLPSLELVHGANRDGNGSYRGDHGTAVLSQLVARDNDQGVLGILPGAHVVVASHYQSGPGPLSSNGHVADAIVALVAGSDPILQAGDVLLLEVERSGRPTEVDAFDFDAIRLAVANGIHVVEAAGNGAIDLDRERTDDHRSLNPRSIDFADSGALMVGAAESRAPHNRAWYSNYGSRVNCFGWGDSVVAAGYGDLLGDSDSSLYTDTFSGTSSAAPMIAGAAALVQTVYRQNAAPEIVPGPTMDPERWERLSPNQLRQLLSNHNTGTQQGRGRAGNIGVMPDLRALIDKSLGLVPRVYMRDHASDRGLRNGRRRFTSPDILVTSEKSGTFDEGSGTEDQLVDETAANGTSWVRARYRNSGLQAAQNVTVELYSLPLVTLPTPDRWTKILGSGGESTLDSADVPQGDTLTVGPPLGLPEGTGGLAAHVRFDGSEELRLDTLRAPSAFSWRAYLEMLRERRDVALRCVRTLNRIQAQSRADFSFDLVGTVDAPRVFAFEIVQRLPAGATVTLNAPIGLALKLCQGRLWRPLRTGGGDRAALHLPKQPRVGFNPLRLPPAVAFDCHFAISGGQHLGNGHSLAIRQLYRGQEVGCITWLFRD